MQREAGRVKNIDTPALPSPIKREGLKMPKAEVNFGKSKMKRINTGFPPKAVSRIAPGPAFSFISREGCRRISPASFQFKEVLRVEDFEEKDKLLDIRFSQLRVFYALPCASASPPSMGGE